MSPTTDVLRPFVARLAEAGVETPEVDVRLLVAHALGVPPRQVPSALPDVTAAQLDDVRVLVERRAERVPLQHLTGVAPFRYLEVEVRPGVFVPRPETEIVVGIALEHLRAERGHRTVIEPCTGTGAIALSIVTEQPDVHVVATEVDPTAVSLASRNLSRVRSGEAGVDGLQHGATIEILEGDLLDPIDDELRGEVDLLVSNPPYLPLRDRAGMAPEVAEHDPAAALFGGEDGHEVVERLLALASDWLRPGGAVVIEIDDRRGDDARDAALRAGLDGVRIVRDLTGRDRVLVACVPGGRS